MTQTTGDESSIAVAMPLTRFVALQFSARITNADLAKRVALSASPCWNRVRHLEAAGVIEKYVTIISQSAIGMPDSVILEAKLQQHDDDTLKRFE